MPNEQIDLLSPHTLKTLAADDPRISSTSLWSSDAWVFDGVSPGLTEEARRIKWSLPCGPALLERFRLLAAHAFIGRAGMKTFKGTSAPQFSIGARFLAGFMVEKGIEDFSGLTGAAFKAYCRKIEGRLVSLDDAEDDVEEADVVPSIIDENWDGAQTLKRVRNDISHSQAFVRLRVWKLVVDLSRDLRAGGAGGPTFNPFATVRLNILASKLSSRSDERIPPLPDEVAMPILNDAHRLIMQPAEDVIALHSAVIAAIDALGREDADEEKPLQLIRDFTFSPIGKDEKPWREPITVASDKHATGGKLAVRHLVTLIRDAAIIVIVGDTGVRMGELCSVEVEPREMGDWERLPSCILVETSQTELSELFFLNGLLTKGKEEAVAERWLVGSRPVGASWEPPAVRAVRVLERLLEPWRSLTGDEWLGRQLLVNLTRSALARKPADVIAILQAGLVRSMREYVAERIKPKELLAPLMPNEELEPYWEKNGRCIRPHQWRKTFLRYMIRADDGLLPAVSQHFKHYTLAVTEQGYLPDDPALIEEVNSVRRRETVRFMYERRHGTGRTAARLDKTVQRSRDQLVELIGDLPQAQAEPILENFVSEHDLDIWFSSHGRCLIALDPDMARCRSHEEASGILVRSPNVLTRTPTMCAGCANFSVGKESAGFWRARYVENQTAWIESGHIRTFRVARARAKQAAAILRALGEPLPTLLARRREAA